MIAKIILCLSALVALNPTLLPGQTKGGGIRVDTVIIYSKILNEERKIYIQSPVPDKENSTTAFPVFYLLDADNHFSMVSEYCHYLGRWDVNVMPEMIVVGITNTDRVRDLTPNHSIINYFGKPDTSSTSWLKNSGGNEQFFKFLHEEVMQYVQSHYKTQSFKIFGGHSFGGITVVNCMLTRPEMFGAYIAVSPSFWWDQEYLLKLSEQKLIKGSALNKILFCSDGSEGVADHSTFHANLLKFDTLIKRKSLTGLAYKYIPYPDETHMTVPVKSYYDGLRFVFSGWSLDVDEAKVSGAIVSDHYQKLSQRYGYTILPNEKNISDWASFLMTRKETLDNAISLFEMLTSAYPLTAKTYLILGKAYMLKGENDKALLNYEKARQLDKKSSRPAGKIKDVGDR